MSDPYKLSDGRKRASSGYGWRIHPKTDQPEFHPGSDFGAPEGTTIPSAASGVVVYSGKNEGGYGNTVIVKNDTGDYSLYAHMRGDNQVKPGQRLWKGDTVGVVGNTGESTGPHVHYSVITKEAGRIYDAAHPRDGGPIGLHPDQTNTYDPATYGNYVLPPPPYLDQSRRASEILSGLDETSSRNGGSPPDRPGQPFFSPFNQPTPAPAKAAPPSTPASSNVFATAIRHGAPFRFRTRRLHPMLRPISPIVSATGRQSFQACPTISLRRMQRHQSRANARRSRTT